MLLVQRTNEVAHLGPEHAFHRTLLQPDDVDLDFPGAQRRRSFEPDKACTDHDRTACAVRKADNRAAVGERAQHMDVGLVRARNRQAHRLRAGREQQSVIGNGLAAGENDIARLGVDRCDLGVEPQIDMRPRRKNHPAAAAASPPARCRRDNPLTDWAGPPGPRPPGSASRCCRDNPAAAASRRRQSPPRRRRRSRSGLAHRPRL